MKRTEMIKRCMLFVISLFFIVLEIALARRGEIGISPVSSGTDTDMVA